MTKLALRLFFAIALAGFSTHALVGSAHAEDKKEEKAEKTDKKKKKEKKSGGEDEKSGW